MKTDTATGSPFENKQLPAWDHQHAFDTARGKYYFMAQTLPAIQRLQRIGGTTSDYYNALTEAYPPAQYPDFYEAFPNVSRSSVPMHTVAAMFRDA
jgi:hypothetical protein